LGGEKALPRELLGEGAAALRGATGAEVRDERPGDADHVEAAVLEEALVFDRENRVHEMRRDAVDRDRNPLLFEDGECRTPFRVIERRRLSHHGDVSYVAGARQTRDD